MNFIKYFTTLFLFYIIFIIKAGAQTPGTDGRVSGRVIDAGNGQPVEFATVVLFKKADNQPARSIQTDMQGNFKLDNIAYGKYLMRITFVGYNNFTKDSLIIGANHKIYAFGVLKMHAGKNSLLKEVAVQGKKNSIQLGIDRKIFSVEQSLVSDGGSATDLLANVPSVQIDVDGNVNLRGSSNVRILIDGKPSLIAGGTVTDILQSIPASSIETIELITNPSSKYDPEGQSGIINIVLKKNKSLGFTGNASLSGGTNNTFNSNLSLAYQHKKVNVYGNYSHRQNNRSGGGYSYRQNILTGFDYNQNSVQSGTQDGNQIKAGLEYSLTDKSSLAFSTNINFRDNNRAQNSTTNVLDATSKLTQQLLANTNSPGNGNNHDFNLDYSTRFKKPKEELTANISLGKGDEHNTDDIFNSTYNYATFGTLRKEQFNINDGQSRNWNIQTDFTDPIGKTGKLELGYRTTMSRAENVFIADTMDFVSNARLHDMALSTDFVYDEKTHAIYSNYQQQFGKFGIQGGARVEKTVINTSLANINTSNVQNYFRVYPSLFLTDKLSETQTLQLSYSRRINRPRDRQIIPFVDTSDPLNLRTGNPNLRPEDVHSFELSFAKYWKSTTLTSSVYYRRTNDVFQFLRTPWDKIGTSLTSFYNFQYGTNAGFEFIARTDITPKWNVTSNVNLYQGFVKGGIVTAKNVLGHDTTTAVADQSSFAYNGNITTNFQLPYSFSGQVRVDYQGPQAVAQGRTKVNSGVDAALKYDFYHRKASLSLNGRDIFNTRKFGYQTNDGTYINDVQRRFQSRTFLLTLAYRFGRAGDSARGKDKKPEGGGAPDDIGGGGGPQ
ncbi:outer membrane receptor protein involved in Fe transport [Mucilaginibacter gracilis]|uniref:Outer membrane receptor protein involved in Fe transport n=1 Tax=Mucilaginibacter gracilis TaxID=423350 RepID=A0A495J9Q3_9SPHI|nr:TonB-dependent receptor [Mucilaginibacter gracilis]RKR85647.1 outer membrane receptor protein involved in Fe transport [Mucilaginibacter gracilis]